MKPKSKILIIAGSDSSGGAGIQADIKTVTALGSYAMTAITAVTSQNTQGVKSIVPIAPREIYNQIIFTSNDIKPDAIKIGMLHSSNVVNSVIKSFNKPLDESKCFLNNELEAFILNERIEGVKEFDINATPTLILNNQKFEKTLSFKNLKKAIEKLL